MSGGIVIVGASHAGISLAEALRKFEYKGPITILEELQGIPTERPPLSKNFLLSDINKSRDSFALRPNSWFEMKDLNLREGIKVLSINREKQVLGLSDSSIISYEKLVLATGADPVKLDFGNNFDEFFLLRNVSDAEAIRESALKSKTALVIGGGYIGLEVAASLRTLGLEVVVIETKERLLERVASPFIAKKITDIHKANGVQFYLECSATSVERDDLNQIKVLLNDGNTIFPEMVVMGVGVKPNSDLARSALLKTNEQDKHSIIVDKNFVTDDPNILAIGDVAYQTETSMRIESVDNAQQDAKQAAAFLTGMPTVKREVPWFWSEQYDTKLQAVGIVPDSKAAVESVVRPSRKEGGWSVWTFEADILRSVETLNDASAFAVGKRFISTQIPLSPEEIGNQSVDIKQLYKEKSQVSSDGKNLPLAT